MKIPFDVNALPIIFHTNQKTMFLTASHVQDLEVNSKATNAFAPTIELFFNGLMGNKPAAAKVRFKMNVTRVIPIFCFNCL